MKNIDAKTLLTKFQKGNCNPEEIEALSYWLHHYRSDIRPKFTETDLNNISSELWTRIEQAIPEQKPMRVTLWPKIAIAAAVLLALFATMLIFRYKDTPEQKTAGVSQNDIDPGKEKAFLILSNGKRVFLDEQSAAAIEQPGVSISKKANGMLVYRISPEEPAGDAQNTLQTPNGGQYQVTLPDGTQVWLNAASSISYPLSFKGKKERIVSLSGEGYFEVMHDSKHPFLVKSGAQTVQVLGTHFNVQAYQDEISIKTTLISGAVKVSGGNNQPSKVLKPGQQSNFTMQAIQVSTADIEQAIAWRNNDFVFSGENLSEVMRQISRWYDVEVEFKGNIGETAFYSTISRKKKLSEILKALTLNQGVHFKIEGRRVTVMP